MILMHVNEPSGLGLRRARTNGDANGGGFSFAEQSRNLRSCAHVRAAAPSQTWPSMPSRTPCVESFRFVAGHSVTDLAMIGCSGRDPRSHRQVCRLALDTTTARADGCHCPTRIPARERIFAPSLADSRVRHLDKKVWPPTQGGPGN